MDNMSLSQPVVGRVHELEDSTTSEHMESFAHVPMRVELDHAVDWELAQCELLQIRGVYMKICICNGNKVRNKFSLGR